VDQHLYDLGAGVSPGPTSPVASPVRSTGIVLLYILPVVELGQPMFTAIAVALYLGFGTCCESCEVNASVLVPCTRPSPDQYTKISRKFSHCNKQITVFGALSMCLSLSGPIHKHIVKNSEMGRNAKSCRVRTLLERHKSANIPTSSAGSSASATAAKP
jgi:hypothetical protein